MQQLELQSTTLLKESFLILHVLKDSSNHTFGLKKEKKNLNFQIGTKNIIRFSNMACFTNKSELGFKLLHFYNMHVSHYILFSVQNIMSRNNE